MRKYPDVSELFRLKAEWRRQQASRPLAEKMEIAERLRKLSKEIPKLTPGKRAGAENK